MAEHILFDLDGTLTDSAPGIIASVRHALAHFGITEKDEEKLRGFLGPPLDEMFRELYGFSAEDTATAVAVYRQRFVPQGMLENSVYPGIPQMLGTLAAAGKTLHVATSKPLPFAQQILEHFDLARHFTIIGGSPLAPTGFGKAGVIRDVLRQGNIAPATAVMVGDRRHDVDGARACGLPCVGVLYGYGDLSELQAAGAVHIAEDVPALQEILLA